MSETATEAISTPQAVVDDVVVVPEVSSMNGLVPVKSLPCYGLLGAVSPLGLFDPLGFIKCMELLGMKIFYEADIIHIRVAMMATVGYLIRDIIPIHHTI